MAAFDFGKLCSAIEWSQQQLRTPRQKRVDAVRQFAGSHYADNGAEKNVPINLLELAVTIYVQRLAARAPRVMVSSSVDELKPFARNMELALEQVPDEIGLADTMQRAVVEAIFGVGILKVGIASGGEEAYGYDVGEAFVDLVHLDDYFVDMSAKNRKSIAFEGNDYWLPVEEAQAIGGGDALTGDDHTVHGEQGEERAEGVSGAEGADVYGDQVWLRDVWLPRTGELVTYAVKTKKLLRVVKWDGPDCGPYHVLGFSDVPGNLLPLPAVAIWRDLHELANSLFRKLAKQAVGKKRVVAFPGGSDDAAMALKAAGDGEGIKFTGMKPEAIDIGGIDGETLAFFLQTRDIFSYQAGNLDSLGGLGPVAETATQDAGISQAAGARMASMKSRTLAFARGVWRSLAWFEWTNPVRKRTIKKPVDGTDIVLTREWSAETRDGDFLDYNFNIDPYSMEDDSPEIRLQKIKAVLLEVIIPLLPMMQQQGASLDFRKLVELLARLGNLDDLRSLVTFGEPIEGDPAAGGSGMPSFKPAQTTRRYERVNRSAPTRSAKDGILSRGLMGLGIQGSERSSLTRGTS